MWVLCPNSKVPKLYEVSKSGQYKAFLRGSMKQNYRYIQAGYRNRDIKNVTDYNERIEGVPIGDD